MDSVLLRSCLQYKRHLCTASSVVNINHLCSRLPTSQDVQPIVASGVSTIEKIHIRHQRHEGDLSVGALALPGQFTQAFHIALTSTFPETPIKSLQSDAVKFASRLRGRKQPWSDKRVHALSLNFEKEFMHKNKITPQSTRDLNSVDLEHLQSQTESFVSRRLRSVVHHWQRMDYSTSYACLMYLASRTAPEFAIICRIFNEIQVRLPDFRPSYVLDFGSGIGSVLWAVNSIWPVPETDSVTSSGTPPWHGLLEYSGIDVSDKMSHLANLLFHGGTASAPIVSRPGIYLRRFLPVITERQYDIVISAYSMMEFRNLEERLAIIRNLWEKTTDFLIIIELGTYSGYRCVMEARDFILGSSDSSTQASETARDVEKIEELRSAKTMEPGHVFAPCPHDFACPKTLLGKISTCVCIQRYIPLTIGSNKIQDAKSETYSYVVLRKGSRACDEHTSKWSRVLDAVQIRTKHVHCEMCNGELGLIRPVYTKKKDSQFYQHIKRAKSGDVLLNSVLATKIVDGSIR